MDRSQLKQRACSRIDERADEIIDIGERLLRMPELGFREHDSAALAAEALRGLGLERVREGLAITGVRADLRGGRPGPTLAVLGELDALPSRRHAHASPATGAAHTCGHNAQVAMMLGVAMGLVEVSDELRGAIALFAVPAEEYVDTEYRDDLARRSEIEFLAGKPELVRIGAFDDVDLAMMLHAAGNTPDRRFIVGHTTNGFVSKSVRFHGVAAHAASAPDRGVNALNAAALALMAINAQRETFAEKDAIRVHGILDKGGDAVNVVPDDVRMELMVRTASIERLGDVGRIVERACEGAAASVGARVTFVDRPGYLPLVQNAAFTELFAANAATLVGAEHVTRGGHKVGSTDMGDLSQLMPVIHPFGGGYSGFNHTDDFAVTDPEMAYVVPAKALAMTAIDLLAGPEPAAEPILADFEPPLAKEAYLALLRSRGGSDT